MTSKFLRYGLLLAIGMAFAWSVGCQKEDSSSSTSPAANIPTFPSSESQPDRESFAAENFYASENSDCQMGARPEKEAFVVTVPAGDFRITYTTWIGTFHVAARAEKCAKLTIGLSPCDEVKSVSIQRGAITSVGCVTWPSGPVTLYSWPCGGTAECSQVFTADASAPVTLLSGGGSAVNPLPTCGRAPAPCQGNNCGGQTTPVPSATATPMPLVCPGGMKVAEEFNVPRTDTYLVNLGKSSGTFRFEYYTDTVPDHMLVTYQGRTLFDSGCVGTGITKTTCLTYAGQETSVIVTVDSMCAERSTRTVWNFNVACPQ